MPVSSMRIWFTSHPSSVSRSRSLRAMRSRAFLFCTMISCAVLYARSRIRRTSLSFSMAEGAAARDDRDLVQRIGGRKDRGHDRVTRLVIRGVPLLAITHHHRLPFHAHQHLVLGELEVDHLHFLLVVTRRVQRGLVDEIG